MKVTMPPVGIAPGFEEKFNAKCPECGGVIIRKRRWQRYCSSSCRVKAFRSVRRREERATHQDLQFSRAERAALQARREGRNVERPPYNRNAEHDWALRTAWEDACVEGDQRRAQRPEPLPVTDADARAAGIDDDAAEGT